ncbi:cytochrome P450 [Mycena pura]|uniref:Cytochrome P450 n=1 Tax=Mycena pura TaxID=153505 RepID=A0AAD6UY89_9AGAR|nr:cytochrome P450 [Mycena pura]
MPLSIGLTSIGILTVAFFLVRFILRDHLFPLFPSTPLLGPPRLSLLWGQNKFLRSLSPDDVGKVYEGWAEKYGAVFRIPQYLGRSRIVVLDPRAVEVFYEGETEVFVGTGVAKRFIGDLFGKGLLWAEGESHRRQRKALAPAFSNTAVRRLTSVFFDSAYKLKSHWDSLIDAQPNGNHIVDVQSWMNRVALDSIGIAGFSHEFGSLDGKPCEVTDAFENLSNARPSPLQNIQFLLGMFLPWVKDWIPTERGRKLDELKISLRKVANKLIERSRVSGVTNSEDKSIIGLLIKAESSEGKLHMSEEEVLAQNVLLLAGYETTSISLTWALIELSYNLAVQAKLREELLRNPNADRNEDQGMEKLPYLDAVVHEVLRMHPPLAETTRTAATNTTLPLLSPLPGRHDASVAIQKGETVSVPIVCINRAEAVWGPDAKEFRPERWLEPGDSDAYTQVSGYRHLLTFSDGQRACLGRGFALAEFKAVLSVLIRNFEFAFPVGPEGKEPEIRIKREGILPRPKVVGCAGVEVPLLVRKVDSRFQDFDVLT